MCYKHQLKKAEFLNQADIIHNSSESSKESGADGKQEDVAVSHQ